MAVMPADLPDINVWLALTDQNHAHHARAERYWHDESRPQIAFCRTSLLGLLRLATNAKVMAGRPFTPPEIWNAYRAYRALPDVPLLPEPPELETHMRRWSDRAAFPVNRWTDCYLAAFASAHGCRLVSFDRDFHSFAELNFLHLKP